MKMRIASRPYRHRKEKYIRARGFDRQIGDENMNGRSCSLPVLIIA
jgi:hypothetical protein